MRAKGRWAAACLLLAPLAPPLGACSPSIPEPAFWFDHGPDDHEGFLAGELGVLSPGFSEPYLYVAYRHLAGLDVGGASRAAIDELWQDAPPSSWQYDAVREWNEAVRQATGQYRSARTVQPQRLLTGPDGRYQGYFINCLEDAFRTAAATLRARVAHYGAGSPQVGDWVAAQDTVFSNCGAGRPADGASGEAQLPDPLGEDAEALARTDRAYQIAAAHFYALEFDAAAGRFRDVADDRASPWSDLAGYLEARSHIRSSSVGSRPGEEGFARAIGVLDAILDDPSRVAVHTISRRLRQYASIRLDPDGERDRLRQSLTAAHLEPPLRQDLTDYRWLLSPDVAANLADAADLDRWLLTFRLDRQPDVVEQVAEAAGDSELWLAAALARTYGQQPWSAALLAAAERVPPTSAIYPTARYHSARIQRARGDDEAARAGLERAFPELRARLSPGDRARFSILMAEVAPTLEARIALGQQPPISYTSERDGRGDSPIGDGSSFLRSFAEQTLPADVAVDALNLSSTSRLVHLLESHSVEPTLRERLAPIVWTRAAILGEEPLALELESIVAAAAPELADELERYRQASSGDERMFRAALSILRFPGLRPTLRHGFGRYGAGSRWVGEVASSLGEFSSLRDNWWCYDPMHGISPRTLATLAEDDRAEAERTIAQLGQLPPATAHLGYIVLAWAERHRDDRRVPEALHRVVRGTRLCPGGDISRVAFETLHGRYPRSEWAGKTAYWYD